MAEGGTGYAERVVNDKVKDEQRTKLDKDMEDTLKSLKERCKRTVLRKIENDEVTFDPVKKIFVYKDTEEEYKIDEKGEKDDDDSDDDDDEEDEPTQKPVKASAKEKKVTIKEPGEESKGHSSDEEDV